MSAGAAFLHVNSAVEHPAQGQAIHHSAIPVDNSPYHH
jgi:hypothetical protein